MQPAEQPSPLAVFPSSHASLPRRFPSPQTVPHVLREPMLDEHLQPLSTTQFALHPSPLMLFPSSHASLEVCTPSPHRFGSVQMLLLGAIELVEESVQVHPDSTAQELLHPSPLTVLPSSQASTDTRSASPQRMK